MRRLALGSIAAIAIAACGGEERQGAPPPPREATTSPAPRHDPRFVASCRASEPTRFASGLPRVRGVAIAVGDTSQTIVVDGDAGAISAIASRVVEGATPQPIAMPGSEGLFALEAIDGERFVVITRGACPEGHQATHCLAARLLGPDAGVRSEPAIIELPGALRTVRVGASGETVWIARTTAGAQPALDRIVAGEGSLEVTTRELGEGIDAREQATEILGLAVSGGSWAVLWRHGAAEDATSGVVLSTQLDEHDVEALHEALVLESFQWYAGALSVIAAFEFARPIFVRIGADGEVRGDVRAVPPGEAPPQPFATRRTAAIVGSGERLELEVRDGAGDAIAPRVAIEGAFVADVARRGDSFVVAYVRRDGGLVIETRDVTCAAAR
ncbi:hypothetical protein [Sandaracinus amylolyticus]|uniref:hypothetical protein n=1 Tax=Sandaracinus amylolyticus TaxID=927083 RepID=UPI001F25B869|nr:hypothetical protein [Sandaracinus amylolyticus]UJR79087.1 Hypothetical protein I5071_11200 [Sandaracinus amylolyticus]